MAIEDILNQIHPLPKHSMLRIVEEVEAISLQKGKILFHANKIEQSVYFINKGIVRAYAPTDGDDITFWFGREGDLVISIKSFVENKRSYETIELLEDCELYKLNMLYLQNLFLQDINIANWGRKLIEQEFIKTEERLISRQMTTALERYKMLLKNTPDLLQRVPLKYIASYLGVTQVTLSRIRAEIK